MAAVSFLALVLLALPCTATTTTPSGLQFVAVTPCRVADTRLAAGSFGGPELSAGESREFDIPKSTCNIPGSAVAYSLNVTVVPDTLLSYLTIWPSGEAQPLVSTLNSDGRVKANAAITPAGSNGGVSIYVTNSTQVILDIDGYFVPAGTASALAFYPITPCRLVDTRAATAPLGGPFLSGGSSRAFPILSSGCNIPSTAQAYSLNTTAIPHTTLAYLTIWPAGQPQPLVSTLNATSGEVTANAAVVPAGSGGDVSVFVYDDADLVLDVNGYFAPPATGGLALYPVTPCRVIDTRAGAGAFNGLLSVPVEASACNLPAVAQEYVLNATVVPSGVLDYLTLWADGLTQPNVSTLNAVDGAITSNLALVPNNDGSVDAFASNATQLILDISGYFAPPVSPVTPTPGITSVSPTQFMAGSADTAIEVYGTNLIASSVVQWNGVPLASSLYFENELVAVVPAADLAAAGTASVTVSTPTSNPSLSNAVTVTITSAPAQTLTSIYPNAGPVNTLAVVTLNGTGFTAQSTVAVNGQTIFCTFQNSTQITCPIPASDLALPGNANVTVTNPGVGGGTTAPLTFTTYLAIANNDIVYNANDGLLYASVPVSAIGNGGNSVVGIDPLTGNVIRQIQVGSNPNKLALSTDGTQLFVGLDGAGAVAQVDLKKGIVVNQFSLSGGQGAYNPPFLASYLAAVPGLPNSVAVASSGTFDSGNDVTIFDSGVARGTSSSNIGVGPLCFGSSASILYMGNGQTIQELTVNSTGITGETPFAAVNGQVTSIQYDKGELYLSTGQVFNSSTGALLGTFYNGSSPATGPTFSDSTLNRAFVGVTNYTSSGQVLIFDEATFNAAGSIPVNGVGSQGYSTNFQKIVRWGQNGIALSAAASAYNSVNQIFIFQSPLVEDLSGSPADLSVKLTAPANATTGKIISWIAKISNNGPDQAEGATLNMNLDPSLIVNSVTPSQGTCGTGTEFTCNLGTLANGASATVTVEAAPSTAGTLAGVAIVSSTSYDPTTTNNQASTSTVVAGSLYGAVPVVSAISPNLVQAGSSNFTLTVTGNGFNPASTVNLGTTPVATTYVSSTELTAEVTAAEIANYGWTAVTVSNPVPGGGISQILPLTIYALVNVPASAILFEPYSQQLYATVPSTATNIVGNSVVAIDPFTAALGTPVNVGSQPTVMAETTDGNYLYVGLSGSNSLAQFDLQHQSLRATIPLSFIQFGSTISVSATWLDAMPGSDTTLAIGVTDINGDFGIFDISGTTGSFRPDVSVFYAGGNPIFADASHVYAYDNSGDFYRYSVDANGLNLIDGTTVDSLGGFSGSIQLEDGRVYGAGGGIINPSTTPPSQVARLQLLDFYNTADTAEGVGIAADPSLQKEFVMIENLGGTPAYGLARYDLTTYLPEAVVGFQMSMSSVGTAWTMFRFGQDGLALLSSVTTYGNGNQVTNVVMLMRGPFVTPQLLAVNSAATLTSSSSSSIPHGSGNILLTLTGSNLLPGVAVTWNGSYRTTTWLDSGHATVAVPASDLANAGSVSLVATNPGAPRSNAVQITIN